MKTEFFRFLIFLLVANVFWFNDVSHNSKKVAKKVLKLHKNQFENAIKFVMSLHGQVDGLKVNCKGFTS